MAVPLRGCCIGGSCGASTSCASTPSGPPASALPSHAAAAVGCHRTLHGRSRPRGDSRRSRVAPEIGRRGACLRCAWALAAFSTGTISRSWPPTGSTTGTSRTRSGRRPTSWPSSAASLVGLYAARALDLANLDGHRSALIKKLLFAGAIVGVMENTVFTGTSSRAHAVRPAVRAEAQRRERIPGLHAGLRRRPRTAVHEPALEPCRRVRSAPLGQMALTAYLLQTVVRDLALLRLRARSAPHGQDWTRVDRVGLGCWATAVQVRTRAGLMRRFRFGPAEWLWRNLTYGQVQRLKATLSPEA